MSEAAAASDMGVEADVVRIMQMIPHRYPFLMIDRVVEIVSHYLKRVWLKEERRSGCLHHHRPPRRARWTEL